MEINKNGAISNGWVIKRERTCICEQNSCTFGSSCGQLATLCHGCHTCPGLFAHVGSGEICSPRQPSERVSKVVSLVAVHMLQLFLTDKVETPAMRGTSTCPAGYFLESIVNVI